MILITSVHISGFRSIQECSIDKFGNLVALVGKNSSGKSNILRALNLFFNDEVQPGEKLSFATDVFTSPKQRKKKRISIDVTFVLPTSFVFKKQLKHLSSVGREFTITRTWEMDNQLNVVSNSTIQAADGSSQATPDMISQLLSLITFRYIPNRTVPTDILRDESQALASSVLIRMKDQSHVAVLMGELTIAAARMIKGASDSMQTAGSPLRDPTVTTTSLSQMMSMSGFQAKSIDGALVRDAQWGAGHQASFLYHILNTIDTDYRRFFGWRQATVWAVEEPESALHRDLEIALAADLRKWSSEPAYRLQILFTSHSPIFAMASDVGAWITLGEKGTKALPMSIQSLTKAAESKGVSHWTHPLLAHPWNPVVLVEGVNDVEVLTHVAMLAGFDRFRFLALPILDDSEAGSGKDNIISYLRRNHKLVQNRQREAPFLVAFDWEISQSDLTKARNAYGPGGTDYVIRMDHCHCDPLLSKDFKGIERFYPPRIFRDAHSAGELILGFSVQQPYSISKTQLDSAKHKLMLRLKQTNDPKELQPLIKVLQDVDRALLQSVQVQRDLFQNPTGI